MFAALAVVAGAAAATPAPRAVAVLGVVAGAWARKPWVLVASVFLLASGLGAAAADGLRDVPFGRVASSATLVADPVEGSFGTSAEVRLGAKRWLVRANGAGAGALARARMGERISLQGKSRSPPRAARWMTARHLVGVITVTSVEMIDHGAAPYRGANRLRALIDEGAQVLPEQHRVLFAGLVIGDDRGQSPQTLEDFQASGLSHILVVSGQNLAYVLTLLQPTLTRLSWRGRWLASIAVIAGFALVTRVEPSVMRASAMAAIAITGQALGRPQQTRRVLALAVAALVLIDPLLVRSVGFQLSVGASVGIALLARPLARRIPGPRALADVLASTVAAQFGVAPVLVPFVGGLPVVALVANPLAVPVAGLITMWGLPAGLLAGLLAPSHQRIGAELLHVPTEAMVGWVALVARTTARLPLGEVGPVHLVALVALGLVAGDVVPALGGRGPRRIAAAGLAAVLAIPGVALARQSPTRPLPDGAGQVVQADGLTILVMEGRVGDVELLRVARRAGVRRVDVLVEGHGRGDRSAGLLRHRWPVGSVVERPEAGVVRFRAGSQSISVPADGPIEVVGPSP